MRDKAYGSFSRTGPTGSETSLVRQRLSGFDGSPLMSVLLVVSDADEIWIKGSISSVLDQTYPYVELCVCDNASKRPHVSEVLEESAASDDRVKVRRLQKPVLPAEAYNQALSLATGRFVTLLGEGDTLVPEAMFKMVNLLRNTQADVVYGDEDSEDISDRISNTIFKPYWSPDMFLSTPYVGRPCAIRRDVVEGLGGFRSGFEGAEEYDLMLRVAENTDRIRHLPEVLYHRRVYEKEPTREEYVARETLERAVSEALERRSVKATVEPGSAPDSVRVVRGLSGRPTVSVVALVTGMDFLDHTRQIVQSSSYPIREVIPAVIGEGVVPGEAPANGASAAGVANLAAGQATGEYLLFVHNFQGALSPEWLTGLLRQAQRPEVGVVGGRVLNSSGGTRSAGSYQSSLSRLTGSPESALSQEEPSRFLPVVSDQFNPYAVSAECLMIRRSLFEDASGFDEGNLPTAFYDLDFSFRLREKGLLNVYTPEASLFSRTSDYPLPGIEEVEYMWDRWWAMLVKALYYRDSPLRTEEESLDDDLLLLVSV